MPWPHRGPDPMMDAAENALLELGVPGERVHTERFNMLLSPSASTLVLAMLEAQQAAPTAGWSRLEMEAG